jgi:hypothetical protein
MYLAYFDESGDSGVPGVVNTPTRFFVLSCVLIHQDEWLSSLDHLVRLRGYLRATYGIPARPEIKSSDIRRGHGVLTTFHWSMAQRMDFYRWLMQWQNSTLTAAQCFSIAIEKASAHARGWEPRTAAWTFAIQRLDKLAVEKKDKVMIFPDEGHGMFIRRLLRQLRRRQIIQIIPGHFGRMPLSIPAERIIEDPNDRKSHDSYFIQLADWNAYATYRSFYVEPQPGVPDDLWDELRDIHRLSVNSLTGGPPAIVYYPRPSTGWRLRPPTP